MWCLGSLCQPPTHPLQQYGQYLSHVYPETGERKLAENLVLIDILGVIEQCGYNIENVLKFIGSKPPEFFDQFGEQVEE